MALKGSLHPNICQGKSNQREMKTVRYSEDSLYLVFDIAEFDCTEEKTYFCLLKTFFQMFANLLSLWTRLAASQTMLTCSPENT